LWYSVVEDLCGRQATWASLKSVLPPGKARLLAGMNRRDFEELLGQRGVPFSLPFTVTGCRRSTSAMKK